MTKINSSAPPTIGVSSCLLGNRVRYDGGHKKSSDIVDTLSSRFNLVPFCPEVAVGMGIPRPPIQLVMTSTGIRALGIADPEMDMTDALSTYARSIHNELANLSGYIFKKNSPSCGIEQVKVFTGDSQAQATGQGIFAAAIMQTWPMLPVIEEDALEDPVRREEFTVRVLRFHQQQTFSDRPG